MPKIQFNDVTPPSRRSIRNVPIPNTGKRRSVSDLKYQKERHDEVGPAITPQSQKVDEFYYPARTEEPERQKKSKKPKVILVTAAAVLILGLIGIVMTIFASASVSITPKSQEVEVDMEIPIAMESVNGGVRYEVVKSTKSKTATVEATGEEAVELRAAGRIIIYNDYSTEPQRLVTRTRFESPEGLIYRIQEGVVVPGKRVSGGAETPGSIEVEVFADEAGEKYNIKKTDFTIPGFKNDQARYEKFYARALTDMTGGFVGNRKTVPASEKEAAFKTIDSELQAELEKDLRTKIPEGLVLLPQGILYESREMAPKESSSSVEIGKEVTAYALMLNATELSGAITGEYASESEEWANIKPIVADFSMLKISNLPSSLQSGENMTLNIAGKAQIVADIDKDKIKQLLLGAPRENAASLVNESSGISKITTIIRPAWKKSFPNNPLRISVQTTSN